MKSKNAVAMKIEKKNILGTIKDTAIKAGVIASLGAFAMGCGDNGGNPTGSSDPGKNEPTKKVDPNLWHPTCTHNPSFFSTYTYEDGGKTENFCENGYLCSRTTSPSIPTRTQCSKPDDAYVK